MIGFTRFASRAEHSGVAERVSLLELRLLRRRKNVLDRGSTPPPDVDVESTFLARLPHHGGLG
jgi:hypothetical protein